MTAAGGKSGEQPAVVEYGLEFVEDSTPFRSL
jgi:hypothetical protein